MSLRLGVNCWLITTRDLVVNYIKTGDHTTPPHPHFCLHYIIGFMCYFLLYSGLHVDRDWFSCLWMYCYRASIPPSFHPCYKTIHASILRRECNVSSLVFPHRHSLQTKHRSTSLLLKLRKRSEQSCSTPPMFRKVLLLLLSVHPNVSDCFI